MDNSGDLFFCFSILTLVLAARKKEYKSKIDNKFCYQSADVSHSSTVSAPGKVLIAGGYLVLESPNIGLTVAATARFYTTVEVSKIPVASNSSTTEDTLSISVHSPQFHSKYNYTFSCSEDKLNVLGDESNEFIEKCISLTLSFIKNFMGDEQFSRRAFSINKAGQIMVKLRADNDFYSQIEEVRFHGSYINLLDNY